MLDFENIGEKFVQVVNSDDWKSLQSKFNLSNDVYVLGHGGNLAIADHAAVDMTRLSNGTKNAICPGSAIVATSLINDTSFEQWMVNWLRARTTTKTKTQMKKSLVLGVSSSGSSTDIIKALQWADDNNMHIAMITSKPIKIQIPNLTQVILGAEYYHTSEVLTLLLTYQLTHGSGNVCPPIGKNSPDDIKNAKHWRAKIREYAYPDEQVNIGVDFDGVLHQCSKGYYDGTIYDPPVDGAIEALEALSKKYNVIVYTCKAKADRGLVNGKTGTQMIWEWLEKHDASKYVAKVTAEKPRAVAYIDDKAFRFSGWKSCVKELAEADIL